MTNYKFRKLKDKKRRQADKHNKLVEYGLKKHVINEYDLIKEEYMMGKHEDLTENQLDEVINECLRFGRGGVNG